MSFDDIDEGPSDQDLDRFALDDPDDFDDGLFPDERWSSAGAGHGLRWSNARLATIAGILLIIFLVAIAATI